MLRDAGEGFFHRDDHGIEVRDLGREPVELLESVMKLGDEQHFYARREALAPPLPRKHENAALVLPRGVSEAKTQARRLRDAARASVPMKSTPREAGRSAGTAVQQAAHERSRTSTGFPIRS